jgi:hypothetical protein
MRSTRRRINTGGRTTEGVWCDGGGARGHARREITTGRRRRNPRVVEPEHGPRAREHGMRDGARRGAQRQWITAGESEGAGTRQARQSKAWGAMAAESRFTHLTGKRKGESDPLNMRGSARCTQVQIRSTTGERRKGGRDQTNHRQDGR